MSKNLLEDIRRDAFRELSRRDGIGSFLNLNYEQTKLLNSGDHQKLRPILERALASYKRSLWWMGIGIPVVLALIHWWLQNPPVSVILTLIFVSEIAYLLKVSLPRIAAMERACILFDVYDSHAPDRSLSER